MHHRQQLAHRLHAALMRELGQGIDVKQMLGSVLYARDVLLVCQAYPGSELQQLGQQFRLAEVEAPWPEASARFGAWRRDRSGFGVSKPGTSESFSDFDALIDSAHEAGQATRHTARRWLTPSTWFTR